MSMMDQPAPEAHGAPRDTGRPSYSVKSYRQIIQCAQRAGYRFRQFDAEDAFAPGTILLRHDVDYSLDMALEVARVNADLGVRGTFLLLARSETYNLLSESALRSVEQIARLGQALGLHATVPPSTSSTADEIGALVRSDFDLIKGEISGLSPVFSWHNPTEAILERTSPNPTIGGLVNCYAAPFIRDALYMADSNLRHTVAAFMEAVSDARHARIQLLLHPLNWVAGGDTMIGVLAETWKYLLRACERQLLTNRVYGQHFPHGLPPEVLDGLAAQVRRSADGGVTEAGARHDDWARHDLAGQQGPS